MATCWPPQGLTHPLVPADRYPTSSSGPSVTRQAMANYDSLTPLRLSHRLVGGNAGRVAANQQAARAHWRSSTVTMRATRRHLRLGQ